MKPAMERAIDTRAAVAINVITMVGIGPLITIPLVLAQLGGALALLGWIAGAVVALCDGLVWAELSSRFPSSGGTYVYLREAFGPQRLGRALAFLFNWQFLLSAPFLLASGYVGFAQYAVYLAPQLQGWLPMHLCAIGVGVLTIGLLLRKTAAVSSTGLLLGAVAVLTLALIALAALTHANWHLAMQLPTHVAFGWGLLAGFATALYITLYDYVGYADVALLGDEVREPVRTIPRAIVISILLVAGLYIALQCGVLGVIPWHSLFTPGGAPTPASQYVGSLVVERTWGGLAARAVTVLVLVTAFASVYGNLLGFSRIPFAAARDDAFLPVFARLHPRTHIPQVALLVVGGLSLLASLFPLDEIIAILTAGIVVIQSVLQIFALAVLRRRGAAPFRMPLYPLPALVALAGWLLAFSFTGTLAIELGIAWLAAGSVVFLAVARARRFWPFAGGIAAALLLLLTPRPALAAPVGDWATWNTSRVVQIEGHPVFEVDGTPFFVWGAAFFYERVPADEWQTWLEQYRYDAYVNTIDLYVPWNWQEPQPGKLDFTGRTNPRRNLIGLLKIIHALGFKVVLRPGPVIRNEWRNGGYPDWLLERPEYDMPLHDVLEGRYPATATLQNQHADAAAGEWLRNETHLHYAAQWLHDVLSAAAPYSHDVIAIALDDDQGAYLDNDTWPAPHWHEYVGWLRHAVQAATGHRVPLFINTYESKVTADAPAWAWGDWYQSSAYEIGAHDREQIDFATDLLGTQTSFPIMMAEFQAGWLQGADENEPRPAAPSNTTLALGELLADGAHGIVNFPLQDTVYPAGWEVPWANWAYDWDAALPNSSRDGPTAAFGRLVAGFGSLLAATHPVVDAHVIWPVSLFPPSASASSADFAAATIAMLQQCRERGLTCDVRDVRYEPRPDPDGAPYVLPIVLNDGEALSPQALVRLNALRRDDRLASSLAELRSRSFSGEHGAGVLLAQPTGESGFVLVDNWESHEVAVGPYVVRLEHGLARTSRVLVPARSMALLPVPNRRTLLPITRMTLVRRPPPCMPFFAFGTSMLPLRPSCARPRTSLFRYDAFRDGYGVVEMRSGETIVVFAPHAGARVACLCDRAGNNAAATIGMLRDAVDPEATPSARDYIAAFTHPIPAGTFNRPYTCTLARATRSAEASCSYAAPDVPNGGAIFSRTLRAGDGAIDVFERMTPRDPASTARLKSISAFAFESGDSLVQRGSCFGVYKEVRAHLEGGRICWDPSELGSFDVERTRGAAILTLHFKGDDAHLRLRALSP